MLLESPELCRWVTSLCEPPHLRGPGGALSFARPGLCAWVKHLLHTRSLERTGACGLGERHREATLSTTGMAGCILVRVSEREARK